jgi:hypothetical protein
MSLVKADVEVAMSLLAQVVLLQSGKKATGKKAAKKLNIQDPPKPKITKKVSKKKKQSGSVKATSKQASREVPAKPKSASQEKGSKNDYVKQTSKE